MRKSLIHPGETAECGMDVKEFELCCSMEQHHPVVKLIDNLQINAGTNTRKEDVCRIHRDIWFGREVFDEAICRE